MKINVSVRLKNPIFWSTFIPAIVACLYTTLGLFDIVPPISEHQIIQLSSMIISMLTAVGVLVDPTTKGVGDSERALGYKDLK